MKLVDKIDFKEAIRLDNKLYFLDSKPDNKNNKSDKDADSKPTTINKAIEFNFNNIEKFCKICIKSKYTRIDKLKKMMLKTKKLQKIYTNL